MPELPEVETVRLGLTPHLEGKILHGAMIREPRLRWPIPANLNELIRGQRIHHLSRRGKYLLMQLDHGALICHLGMSGSLRLSTTATPPEKHDHFDLLLANESLLRYRDPRRFGALLWSEQPEQHPLITHLGLEPLEPTFNEASLQTLCRGRKTAIKLLIMDAHKIVGVGNIYANESLFHAGIAPQLAAENLTRSRCARLVEAIKSTLTQSILAGGSSLRDFVDGHGKPGYFQQTYFVYGRSGEPCRACGTTLLQTRQSNRSTFFCPRCQRQ
jgi:formamidopyrimidine-DNA glycosylase